MRHSRIPLSPATQVGLALTLALALGLATAGGARAATATAGGGGSGAGGATDHTYDGLVIPFKDVVLSAMLQSQDSTRAIVGISVKEGDHVVAGQQIAQLYNKVEEYEMLKAKAALEKLEFDSNGSNKLYAERIISQDEALKNKIELEVAKIEYQASAEILDERRIVSPIDGIVVEKLHEVGETAVGATPIFRILDISKVYVQFFIRAEDLPYIHKDDVVRVRFPVLDANRVFAGTVDFIDPRVDAASGLMRVKVLVPNPDGFIKAGVRAEVLGSSAASSQG